MMAEPWASVEDVAKHIGVAKDSIYGRIDHRGPPLHKIGRLSKLLEIDACVRAGGATEKLGSAEGDAK